MVGCDDTPFSAREDGIYDRGDHDAQIVCPEAITVAHTPQVELVRL